MSNKNASDSNADWLTNLGRLRPWEVAAANQVVRNQDRSDLPALMAKAAQQIGKRLHEPLMSSDVDLIMSSAADVRGVFADVEGARDMARAAGEGSLGWSLVLSALDGASYEQLEKGTRSPSRRTAQPSFGDFAGRAKGKAAVRGAVKGAVKGVADGLVREGKRPAVPVKDSIKPDYLISLEDGQSFKDLTRHLLKKHNMSPAQYRAKWGLPKDYPMVAANTVKARLRGVRRLGPKGRSTGRSGSGKAVSE